MRFPLALFLLAASPLAAQTADLSVAVTVPAPFTAVGVLLSGAPITITVTNNGPQPATNVVLTETMSYGMSPSAAIQGPGGPCASPDDPGVCAVGTLASGQTVTLHSNPIISVVPQQPTSILVTETVTSSTSDPAPANNTASATMTVFQQTSDLFFTGDIIGNTIAYVGPPIAAGDLVTLSFSSRGTGVVPPSTMTIALPPGAVLVSAPGCTGTGPVTCSLPFFVAPEEHATQLITFHAPLQPGPATLTATLSSQFDADPNLSNNTVTEVLNVVAAVPALSPLALLALGVALAACAIVALRAA